MFLVQGMAPIVPVVHPHVWRITKTRLQCSPLSYQKKMDFVHEIHIQRLTSLCTYQPTIQETIRWDLKWKFDKHRLRCVTNDLCRMCYNRDMRINHREGTKICSWCGFITEENVDANEQASYCQSYHMMSSNSRVKQKVPRQHSPFTYKRFNHFKEVLLRLQGKERLTIQAKEMSMIEQEIKKRSISHDDLNANTMKHILRYLKLEKYYNHTYNIIRRITGFALITLSQSHYDTLFKMFTKIQRPFQSHAPNRANMISYMYIIKKFCEILEWKEISSCLPHLKSRWKVVQQDNIWRKICKDVGFQFIPSVL